MLLKEKKTSFFLLKATQNNVLTPLCIKQYIAVSWYIRGNISISLHTVSLPLYTKVSSILSIGIDIFLLVSPTTSY